MKPSASGDVSFSAAAILVAIVILGSFVPGGCASPEASAAKFQPAKLGATERVHSFDGIYLASQPSPDDLKIAREAGVKTVVNLRKKEEVEWDEKAVVTGLGLEYDNVPFGSAAELTDDVFNETRRILGDSSKKPLLLHCASSNRVGAVWLAFRVLDEGVPYEKALEEAKAAGLKTAALEEKAKAYIEKQKKP
jgi:uncharacterized protein (TIGR01244 family)